MALRVVKFGRFYGSRNLSHLPSVCKVYTKEIKMHGHEWCGFGWHGFSLWWLVPIVLVAIFVMLMWWRRGRPWCGPGPWRSDCRRPDTNDSASVILDERFACGDIDRAQYEEMCTVLERPRNE
jgi:uncharacterized membrane protein